MPNEETPEAMPEVGRPRILAGETGLAKALCPPMTEEMRKEFLEQLQIALDAGGCVYSPDSNNVDYAMTWSETPQGSEYWNNWYTVTR